MPDEKLLSLREAAAKYEVSLGALRTAAKRNYLPTRKIGNQYIVTPSDAEAYAKNRPRRGRPKKNN